MAGPAEAAAGEAKAAGWIGWATGAGASSTGAGSVAGIVSGGSAMTVWPSGSKPLMSASKAEPGSCSAPAANWCSTREISAAAACKVRTWWAEPCNWPCRRCMACSAARAKTERLSKPTVADAPAKECAQAMARSGTVWLGWLAQVSNSSTRLRDHGSASLKYTLYSGRLMLRGPMTTGRSSALASSCGAAWPSPAAAGCPAGS